ncbi:hypothetical protein SAMN04487761_11824 [Lachnospiraceae bacterium C7]|nr:hypothetical protein SAMN04487761_11824 [Lachnospiraceae bacterium C7]
MFGTRQNKLGKYVIPFIPLILFIGLLFYFCIFSNSLTSKNINEEQDILTQSLDKGITTCYVVEGFYPPNIEYLEKNYALKYDKDVFVINYTVIADNLRPTYVILKKDNTNK